MREYIDKNCKIVVAVSVGVIAIGLVCILIESHDRRAHELGPVRAFYSTNDGVSVFEDDVKTPPFNHQGAQAVQAFVYTCDGGAHHWVQYLLKYSDDALKQLALKQPLDGPSYGILVKKPGRSEWIPQGTPEAVKLMEPKRPDGVGSGDVQPLAP
jgi:hypothetical protein